MQVNSTADPGLEPATTATTARPGAQDPGADASGFGALLLLLLPPTPAVPPAPDGTAPALGGQHPGSDAGARDTAILTIAPAIMAALPPGATTTAGGNASVLARGVEAAALVGAGSPTLAPSPAAPVTTTPKASPTPVATDRRAAAPVAPATRRIASFTAATNPTSESESGAVAPAAVATEAVADGVDIVPGAVSGTNAAGGTNAVDEADRAARAVTSGSAPMAPLPDAAASRPEPPPDPRSASARRREGGTVTAPRVDDVARGQGAVAAVTARPALRSGDDDGADSAPRPPSTQRSHGETAEPDAALIARATLSAARLDTPAAASGAAPTDAARSVAEPPVVEQLVRTARLVMRDGLTEMDVQLAPPSLGVVRVTAAAASDGLGLTLAAERPVTRALLLHAIPEMQAALAAQGIATTTIAVASSFDPPGERRAPARRDPERPARAPREAITERPGASRAARAVGAVDLTV